MSRVHDVVAFYESLLKADLAFPDALYRFEKGGFGQYYVMDLQWRFDSDRKARNFFKYVDVVNDRIRVNRLRRGKGRHRTETRFYSVEAVFTPTSTGVTDWLENVKKAHERRRGRKFLGSAFIHALGAELYAQDIATTRRTGKNDVGAEIRIKEGRVMCTKQTLAV
jgi:hypothetical protein